MVRKIVFWLHLAAGAMAGVVILIMSATGVALTYERQLTEWTAAHLRSRPPTPGAARLPVETLLAEVARTRPGQVATGITLSAKPDAPIVVLTEAGPVYVDAYTGESLGDRRGQRLRSFLAEMRAWHRWLGAEGEHRTLGRTITGWSNLAFLFIVVSGAYLWLPRSLSWPHLRAVLFFRWPHGTGRARDFNWHNVIGVWSAIPLFVIVLGAVPISFPWASDLVYRAVGEAPPARVRRDRSAPRPESNAPAPPLGGIDAAFARAVTEEPDWRTITVRLPQHADDPLSLAIDRGNGGQPQLRSTLTIAQSGEVTREAFADQSLGRRIRSVLRFAHTGEVLGVPGQTVAGVVTAGASVLMWTGLSLSMRRFRAWQTRVDQRAARGVPAGATASVGRS